MVKMTTLKPPNRSPSVRGWLKNYSAAEIGEVVGLSRKAIEQNVAENPDLEKVAHSAAARL